MPATAAALYNTLPSVGTANTPFVNGDVLKALNGVFADHPEFAVTVVYQGTFVPQEGSAVEPTDLKVDTAGATPSCWRASGEPFNYSTDLKLPSLPADLLWKFNIALKENNVAEVETFGICAVKDSGVVERRESLAMFSGLEKRQTCICQGGGCCCF